MLKVQRSRQLKAFTLLETAVIIGITFIIVLMLLPYSVDQLRGKKAEAAAKDLRSAIFLQQQNAYSRKGDQAYGVALFSDHYILYSGNSLATATEQDRYDLTSDIAISNINLTSGSELTFSAGSQKPSGYGSFDMGDSQGRYRISINQEGLLTADVL